MRIGGTWGGLWLLGGYGLASRQTWQRCVAMSAFLGLREWIGVVVKEVVVLTFDDVRC